MKKAMKTYANGGYVEDSPEDEMAEGEMMPMPSTNTSDLCRQKVGAPNEREWNQGPGVRSFQDYGKKR